MRRCLLVPFLLFGLSACQLFRTAPILQTDVDSHVLTRAPTDQSSWISDRGSYNQQRYSSSELINEDNLAHLELKWALNLDGPTSQTPLTIDNVIYLAVPGKSVLAVNAETGTPVWKAAGQRTRSRNTTHDHGGMAIWGANVYVASSDGRLLAFDRRKGKLLWQSSVAQQESQFFTSPPRPIGGSIVVSVGGTGEQGGGYLAAYDADTGEEQWQYLADNRADSVSVNEDADSPLNNEEMNEDTNETVHEEEPAEQESLQFLAYDGELDILYLAVWTDLESEQTRHSSCPRLVAIQAKNGDYLWELAEASSPVRLCSQHAVALADLAIDGRMRALLVQSLGSSGLNLVDRITGQAITVDSQASFEVLPDQAVPEDEPVRSADCGHDQVSEDLPFSSAMALDPINKLVFLGLEANDSEQGCRASAGYLLAWDPVKRDARWRVRRPDRTIGLLASGGNLLFQSAETELVIYQSNSGERLWAYPLEGASAPISYQIDGRQYIALVANASETNPAPQLMVFTLKEPINLSVK